MPKQTIYIRIHHGSCVIIWRNEEE
jgi:hypothetical protein